jgi:hypothetical protein
LEDGPKSSNQPNPRKLICSARPNPASSRPHFVRVVRGAKNHFIGYNSQRF